MSDSTRISTVVTACVATAVTAFVAYAVYFDHRRRTDPEFRKALKRESRKQARAAKEEAEAQGAQHRRAIREAVDQANEDGFPTNVEEVEAYFKQEVAHGEGLCSDGMELAAVFRSGCKVCSLLVTDSKQVEAALSFYKALKVYPQPRELINVYDKTVPKVWFSERFQGTTCADPVQPILDILAEMIAIDPSISVYAGSDSGSAVNIE